MKLINEIKNFKEVVQQNLDKLGRPIYQNHLCFEVVSQTKAERTIRGGLDEWEKLDSIVITQKGWAMCDYETETNMLAGWIGERITKFHITYIEDERLESYFNSDRCNISEVYQFILKYNETAAEYRDLSPISKYGLS
jgi:hypothetical protein